jgi:hypothetical protein
MCPQNDPNFILNENLLPGSKERAIPRYFPYLSLFPKRGCRAPGRRKVSSTRQKNIIKKITSQKGNVDKDI